MARYLYFPFTSHKILSGPYFLDCKKFGVVRNLYSLSFNGFNDFDIGCEELIIERNSLSVSLHSTCSFVILYTLMPSASHNLSRSESIALRSGLLWYSPSTSIIIFHFAMYISAKYICPPSSNLCWIRAWRFFDLLNPSNTIFSYLVCFDTSSRFAFRHHSTFDSADCLITLPSDVKFDIFVELFILLTNLHTTPFIRIYTQWGRNRIERDVDFTLKRLSYNRFSHKINNFVAFSKFSADFERAYPNAFVENQCRYPSGDASPVGGGRPEQDFRFSYLTTIEPFYLTVDKTARMALIEPLHNVYSSLLSPFAVRSLRAIKKEESKICEPLGFFKGGAATQCQTSISYQSGSLNSVAKINDCFAIYNTHKNNKIVPRSFGMKVFRNCFGVKIKSHITYYYNVTSKNRQNYWQSRGDRFDPGMLHTEHNNNIRNVIRLGISMLECRFQVIFYPNHSDTPDQLQNRFRGQLQNLVEMLKIPTC